MSRKTHAISGRQLRCEQLESRCVLSAVAGGDNFYAVIVAGDPSGSPADSPANRVDANLADSAFAGVGSLRIHARRGTYICTATPFDATHVLTAGHCVDLNNDGRSDKKDGIRSITFQLNLDTDAPADQVDASIPAANWRTHPDYTGFNRPSVSDDLAVITLSQPLPAGVPIYSLAVADMSAGDTRLTMVGYGQSGDGVNGYTLNASWTVKRHGENMVDAFYGQDDAGRAAANEVFRFDFDGPSGNGSFGGGTLGNDVETTLGGGDSGGPSFALVGGSYQLIGVNTFTQGFNAPKFGSLGGGINVFPYVGWIQGVAAGSTSVAGSTGNGGGGGPGSMLGLAVATLPLDSTSLLAGNSLPSSQAATATFVSSNADEGRLSLVESGGAPADILLEKLVPVVVSASPTNLTPLCDTETSRDDWFTDLDSHGGPWSLAAQWLDDTPWLG